MADFDMDAFMAGADQPENEREQTESQGESFDMDAFMAGNGSAASSSVSPAEAGESTHSAPTWESGDGGSATLPVGEKNQWGGSLRTEGRKPLIRRDAKGKVNGYSTTHSMFVKHDDGRIAVVPTVVDGVELSTKDAARHYAETGEYWGMADDEEGAKKIANAVHDEHRKTYQEGWNNYIHDHWDDMGDEIRRDPGVRGERARRKRDARLAKEMEAWGKDVEAIKGYRERTKTTQVAPELFLTGDLLEDSDGNTIKPGGYITVSNAGDDASAGKDGQKIRLMEFTGVNDEGKPVFDEVDAGNDEFKSAIGKLHVSEDDFARMMGRGEGKVKRSPLEQVRLDALANTGDYKRYGDTAFGTATAIADYLVPFVGRIGANRSREAIRHLANIYEGNLDEYSGDTDDEKRSIAAMDAGLDPIRKGETREEYYERIKRDAEDELKKRVIAKMEAGAKLSETEQSILDKIVKGGVESGGYALEFALPGGAIFKGAKALNWGAKAVRTATMLGSAVPVVTTEAASRYQENITPEYGFDDNGEFKMVAAPDDEEEAVYKAIGGAIFDTAVEVGLEAATMGLLRGAGKASGWLLGKATPSAVRELGAKKFYKFMASETGQTLRNINRAYQDFTAMTQINSPLGELAEENVQALEKFLNLDGKTSEHKGFAQEWQDFKDNQLSWQTQWDIFLGLVAQLAIGSAKSAEEGIAQHISSTDARRDARMALKRSGISDEAISMLTPEQQKKLDDMWRQYSADPDALKENVKDLGISMRLAADELLSRESSRMAADLKRSGIEPEKFVIQTGEDGKPAFQQMTRFGFDGSKVPMNAMTDAEHGVTIVDQGDGTFHVMNDWRGLDAIPAYSFEEAQKKADKEVLRNQQKEADNKIAAQRLIELTNPENGPYRGRKVVSIPSEAALRWQVAQAVHDGKEIFGITRADQLFKADGSLKQPGAGGFRTPDGHIVVILDNVPSPAEMERVLAHEATGHEGVESATGRGANTVEFIQNAQAEGFSRFVLAERERAIQRFVAAGMDEATARMQVAAAMSTDDYAREAMARYAQVRLHQPTWYERKKHEANKRRRDAGENVPIDQSDLEVMLAEAEKQGAQGANDLETLPGDSGVRYEEGATDETGNGADEAPAQQADEDAGRDGQQSAEEAEARPEAQDAPGGETPDAGVVATIDNLPDLLKGAAVELVENAGDPSDPGHRVKTASKEEITAKQQEIVDALNDPDPQNFERFLDEMNNHACRTAEMMKFREEWQRLHPEVDINSTPQALANERKALELDIESAKESLANHPNSESLKVKLREAEKKLADFIAAHPDLESAKGGHVPATGGTQGVVEPSKTENGGQKLTGAEQQPMSESSFWNVMHRKGERRRVPVDSIKIPDTQFKENADPKTGVVKGQELGEYYENAENPIAIYERRDGTMEIVTGRHRLDAAKRSGWEDIDARIFREADGYTPEDMRLYDAVANILDEKGTVKDYVRFFDESGFSEEDAKSSGILNRQKGRMAFGIVQNATDDTRGAIDWDGTGGDGLISAEQAAIIAEAAPKQAALQRILVRRALDGVRGKKLAILARSLAEEAKNRKNAPKVEGGTQLDLFTSEEDVALLQQEEKRADYRAKKANEYKRIAENLRTAMRKGGRLDLNKDYAQELGISDPKDKAQLAAARDKAVERMNYWENAIRLDDADKAQMDAELGIAPAKPALQLESVTAEQITAEEKKRREKEAIKKRQDAPLKGSGAVNVQPEMDLGQTGQQDLFSPIAENGNASTDRATEALKSFLDGKGVERAVESLREFAPRALTAKSFDELLKAYVDRLAAWTKDNDEWKRMKSRWGVGRSAETKDEKALQRKVNGGRGALDNIKNMLEFGFPKEFAAFKNLPPAEQARRLGLDVKESDSRVVVTGNTYPLRDMLKDAGFKWDSTASAWTMDAPTAQVTPSDNKTNAQKPAKSTPVSESGVAPGSLSQTPFGGVKMTDAQRDKILSLTQPNGRVKPIVNIGNIVSVVKKDSGDIVFAESRVGRKKTDDDGFEVLRITKDGMFAGSIFYNSNGNMLWPNGHYDEKNHIPELIEDGDLPDDFASRLKTPKNTPASAPKKEGATTPPKATKPAESGKSASGAKPAVWPEGWDNAGEEIKGYVAPQDGDIRPRREVAIAHRSGGSVNAPQKIKGVVESVDGDNVKVYYKDGWGYDQHDTFKKSEIVGVMPSPASGRATSSAKSAKPAFKRGDRVFLKDVKDGQRVTFLKANADGTADVQVRTPGANRYAPEKVETRTVPMAEISSTGMKDTLTDAEKKRLVEGMKAEAAQTIVMPDAAAAKEVRDAFDAIDFDTPELSAKMPDSFKTMKGTPIRRYRGNVGKSVGSQIYVHKDYAGDVVPADVLDAAERIVAGVDGFAYNTLMWDSKRPNVVRFDEAPDFDTAREPHPGRMITVDTESGKVVSDRTNDQIWHHKWLWVKNDYKGFDVNRSKAWSAHWLSMLPEVADGTGHGNARWLAQLAKYGITEPEAVPRQKQGALSGATSRPQVPAADTYGKKWKIFKPGTRNADIGAGRYELATDFLAEIGVENIKFDPVNRDSETNRRAAEDIRANPADTATVNNVLNVIDNDAVMDGIINQAARAIKKNGTALFTIHPGSANKEGAKPGDRIGRQTKGGSYQRYWPAADYVPHIKKYFGHVETHGNVILAKQPKDVGPAFWAFDSTFDVGVSFDTKDEIDFEKFGRLVTGVGNLVDKLTKYGYKDFKSLATYIYEQDAAKYGRAKPVLQDIWNAVARARKLARVSDEQVEAIYAGIEKPKAQTGEVSSPETAAPEAPKPPPANKLKETRISDAADEIAALIERGQKFTRKDVTDIVEHQLGGKVANGDFDAKQVTDILELGVNKWIAGQSYDGKGGLYFAPNGDAKAAVAKIQGLRDILSLIPTQTTRSVEQDKMQQFSTPPTEAFAAAWVANITDKDVMLEPSAGIGGIAVFGANAGAKVVLNELSPRRAEILEQLGIGKPFEHNAENLYAFLEPDIKAGKLKRPTVVVMNPPFSNSQRTDKKNTHIGADHVEQALKLLAPGGRLVAIVGNGMAHDRPAFKAWWDRIGREYTVRANVGVNGQEYAKYGTTFDNNIIVIDKVTPNGSITPIYGKIESLDELPALLEGVRNDRSGIEKRDTDGELTAAQQGGGGSVAPNGADARPAGAGGAGTRAGQGAAGRTRAAGRSGSRPAQSQTGTDAGVGAQDNGTSGVGGGGRAEPSIGVGGNASGLDVRSNPAGGVQPALGGAADEGLTVQSVEQTREVGDGTFSEYRPSKISIPGMKPHPTALVESSAMASVQPPNPTYSPKIPKKIIEDGVLSEAQVEQVIYAGQAHEQKLGGGERKGYFIGDGTGVGKGREISGIILDNFNNGRRKAVWISKTGGLANDAKRDLTPFGLAEELFTMEAKNLKNLGSRSHGVAFTTYASLAKDHERIDERGNIIASKQGKESRMQSLVRWLGRDFDGVIVFDESHLAGNAVPMKGKRGMTKPSAQALAVVDLQKALPNARILYVSATGATEVNNLAYATRLGLWGRGTAFKDRDSFITQVSNGGISVMEIVARDMKAMGVYMARTLSYEGIENERVTHELSPDQVKQYNLMADTWQMVMGEIESALISSNGIHGKANGNAKSAFWGAHQRFFNQTLTAMQMPSVLKKARELWEAGMSPVFQIVSTNEAAQNRAIQNSKEAGGEVDVENLDLSPRDILIGFVENSFPTVQYVEVETEGDSTKWVPLTDTNGNLVHDPAAVERKERLIGRLQRMKMGEAPLDMILNEFGHENVAEVTGRSARREMVRNSDGEMEMRMVRRTKNNAKQEADEFNEGKRTVLVFSGAGNTGFSFHADRKFKNQRRRVQFMIEAGYNAAAAIQGLGRTHRANESSHPLYMLCSTNLPGHKRFMSTIARRLAQLGSLTSGDRSSSGSGVFSEADNLENQYAKNAVLGIFEEMFMEDPAKFNRICTEMGFMKARINRETGEREYVNTLVNDEGEFDGADKLDIPHFLNRILAMKIDAQNELFDEFSKRMAEDIERAKETGTFDPGMEKLKGVTVEVKNRTNLWTDAQGIGSTDIVEVGVTKRSRKTDYERAKRQLEFYAAAGATPRVYTHNASGDVLMMVETKQTRTMKDGSVVTLFKRLKPNGETDYTTETAVEKNYAQVLKDEQVAWTAAYDTVPELIEQSRFFAHGTLLPIWDRLNAQNPRFYKIVPTGGAESRAFLGMEIAPDNVENILHRFGKSVGSVEVTPDVLLNRIMKDGRKVELQNGWTLKRVKVLGDSRIEIDGVDEDADVMRLAREPFAYSEKIGYLRVFVKPNAESLRDFLAEYPAVPDKGGLATASGTAQDLSGDKYKAPLRAYWSRIEEVTPAEATTLGEQMRGFIVRLSSEQLGEIFDDYAALDNDSLSAAHVVRRMALDELVARGALDWRRRQQAESESPGGDIVNFDTPEISLAEDAAYMDAVRRGDMETVQRMVREAAARAGYDVFAYHGTKGDFTVFDKEKIGSANDEGYLGRGFYFWSENNLPYAYQYAGADGKVMQVYLKAQEPHLIEREELESLIAASDRHDTEYILSFTRDLKNNGYDSVVDGNGQILVFDSNAIKSADPVTYDDAGNVIPLSQRFNPQNDDIRFDTPELTPAEAEYAASEDKTPTEKVMREVYGMTNDEIATALKAAGMEPPAHVRKTDADMWRQVETLLSNSTYMAKLSRAVAKFPRPTRDYENISLNVLFRQRQAAVNDLERRRAELAAIPEDDMNKTPELRDELKQVSAKLAQAKAQMAEAGKAAMMGASEQGRALRSNRALIDAHDYSYAGIAGRIAQTLGGVEKITPEMNARIRELAKLFEGLDAEGLRLATERLIPLSKKIIDQTKNGLKVRKATERKTGDEAKRVARNYQDALNQIEVGAVETGGTLIGMSDQQYPGWGKWLKWIGEFHCFENPNITEEECINAIVEDISPFVDADANQVRDALTGFGHNYKMSRYDAQRLMNGLRNISRYKRQLDWMDETNTMPPATGPIRDEPTQDEREWAKKVRDRKEEVPDAGRDERRLKSTLDTIKRNLENRIADLKRAIETGERIPAPKRKVVDDIRVRELRAEKDEWQKRYDELFGTTKTLTPEQKIAMAEKTLNRMLEADLVDLDRARHGDFSKVEGRPAVTEQYIRRLERQAEKGYKTDSPALQALRERRIETLRAIFELKKAKYEFGMTPEEVEALNARKITAREKAVTRLAERVATGDFRTGKPQPPMTKDQQKRYDELGEQMKRGRQKLAELRLEAENATVPTFVRKGVNFLRFVTTAQRALRATMDFSAVLRQAARMTLGHPVKAAQAFGKAWTAARSEASLLDVNTEILSDPTVQEAVRKFGLHIREVDAQSDRDVEMFHGMERNKVKIFGKEYAITDIPLFGEFMLKSERHYLTYLNAMSADLYTSIVNGIPGGATPWQKKMIADMINIWNGSAALSKERRQALQKAWVNDIFWAPQLAISRVQSAVGYDWWHPLVARGIKNADGSFDKVSNDERKTVAKVGLSEHMRSTVAMLAIGALLKWLFSDDDDKYDFSQADWFEKMMMLVSPKIGNTTIDLTGGESTFNKLVHQLATRSKRTGTGRLQKFGDFNGPSTWGAIGRYLQGKLSPSASTIASLWEGKDYVGEEYGAGKMVREMLVPLTFEDVKDQIVQNGVGRSLVTVPLSILGAGGSTYDRKPYENAVNRFLERRDEFAADVRGRIEAKVKAAKKLENQAKELKKDGKPVPQNLLDEIDRQKAETLNLIREARK